MATDIKNPISFTRERENDTVLLSSLTQAFGEALDLAPGLLAVQRGLLGGMALSQRRETARLGRTLDKDHPRLQAAMARSADFDQLRDDAESGLKQSAQVASNVSQPGVFFGYVREGDGAAATGLEVRLVLSDEIFKGEVFKDRTDENGFFRIQVPLDKATQRKSVKVGVEEAVVVVSSTAPGRASVHDDKGQELLRDPLPPTFEANATEMRLYTLGLDANSKR